LTCFASSLYNVGCFYYITNSFGRMNLEECTALKNNLTSFGINVTLYLYDPNNIFNSLAQAGNDSNINAIISIDAEYMLEFQRAVNTFKEKYWIATRTAIPFPNLAVPNNTIWIHSFEPIVWFLKGALAASYSNSSDFCFGIPLRFNTSQYITAANFYFAGLRYINPNARLIAVNSIRPSFNERAVLDKCLEIIPNYEVHTALPAQIFYPPIIEEYNLTIIENQVGFNGPLSDVEAVLGFNVTLTATLWHLQPILEQVLLKLSQGVDMQRDFILVSEVNKKPIVKLAPISPLVPEPIIKDIEKLQEKFLTKMHDVNNPALYCDESVVKILKHVYLVPNGKCINVVSPLNGAIFHPDIEGPFAF